MKQIIFFNLIVLFSHQTFSQNVLGGVAAKGMDMNTVPYGIVSAFGSAEKTTTGSSYLYSDWKTANIELNEGIIPNVPINIDLKNMQIEINTDKGVRLMPAGRIKKLSVGYANIDLQVFESAKGYNGTGAQIYGLVEVLVKNEVTLLKYYYSYQSEGSYNKQLDMGNNETKIHVKVRYLLYKNGSLVEVPKNKKKFLRHFPAQHQQQIAEFLDERNLHLKDQEDLILVCNFLNEKQIKF